MPVLPNHRRRVRTRSPNEAWPQRVDCAASCDATNHGMIRLLELRDGSARPVLPEGRDPAGWHQALSQELRDTELTLSAPRASLLGSAELAASLGLGALLVCGGLLVFAGDLSTGTLVGMKPASV